MEKLLEGPSKGDYTSSVWQGIVYIFPNIEFTEGSPTLTEARRASEWSVNFKSGMGTSNIADGPGLKKATDR